MNNKDIQLKEIRDQVVKCKKCLLWKGRNLPVVGQGDHNSKVMFIGEGPGREEDNSGKPFCGRSGRVLDILLESIELKRKDVYITNIVKCRPPENRDPTIFEISKCTDYLREQIKIIDPQIICTLGLHSMAWAFEEFELDFNSCFISKVHGQVFHYKDRRIIPLYHPAVAVYNETMLKTLLEDFKSIVKLKLPI